MSSKNQKQHNLMVAACRSQSFADKVGISQSVACEFVLADKKAGLWQKKKSSSQSLNIREGREKDVEAFVFFRRLASSESEYNNPYTETEATAMLKSIEKDNEKFVYFLFDRDDIVGELFVDIKKNELYISKISILSDYQGSTIGASKKLIEKAIDIAKEKGLDVISLIVRNDNKKAIGFYKKHGFIYLKEYNKKNSIYHLSLRKEANERLSDLPRSERKAIYHNWKV